MLIVGCDYHPGFQQIAFVDMETGELQERRLVHREEAEKFYRELAASGVKARCKKRLWREPGRQRLEAFPLAQWASRRRRDLLELLDRLNPTIAELSQAVEQEVEKFPEAQRLMTHPGVGALTALAFVLIIGNPERFHHSNQVASYVGLVPTEESSGERRRLGHISKQGSTLLRFFLVEAAQVTVRSDPEWRSKYFHLAMRRGRKIAKVAMARRLAVRLYWMWRKQWDYEQWKAFGPHVGQPETGVGVQ